VWGASPINTRIYNDQRIAADNIAWKSEPEVNPWQVEWNVLLECDPQRRPHNEASRAAYADLASIMGGTAVHLGTHLEHFFGMLLAPEDPIAFETKIDHPADAALNRSAPQGKALGAKRWIFEASRFTVLGQIRDLGVNLTPSRRGSLG